MTLCPEPLHIPQVKLWTSGSGYKGMFLPAGLSAEAWQDIGRRLEWVDGSLNWLWGDWLNYGADRAEAEGKDKEGNGYAGKYGWALELMGLKYGTLRNVAHVCRQIPLTARRNSAALEFSHYAEVARFEPKEREKWLDKVEENKWSVADLREAIRTAKQECVGTAVDLGFVPAVRVSELLRDLKRESVSINDWPASRREALKEELKPLLNELLLFVSQL